MKKINFDEYKVYINNLKIIKYDEDYKYIIKFHEDKCIMLYNNNIVSNPIEICEKYNIFDGKIIIVDIKSFPFNYEGIMNMIIDQYKISYVKKLILEINLPYIKLENYLSQHNCIIMLEELHLQKSIYIIYIKDNFNRLWKLNASFEKDKITWSFYEIIEKIY
jgi:hypothetical protein